MPECTVAELALKLREGKMTPRRHPRFALFVGAGASIESGVPGAAEMVRRFREALNERWLAEESPGDFDAWLRTLPTWDDKASDYANYFEAFEPTEQPRADYIEDLVTDITPNFGYLCLAQLLQQGYLDTVITTNFDDLAYEACALWTGVRPRVYAYGASGGPVRASLVARPSSSSTATSSTRGSKTPAGRSPSRTQTWRPSSAGSWTSRRSSSSAMVGMTIP